jgi:hypothetical protein
MNEKKNIDRFFQEKFKDFEEKPNEMIWRNIQLALEEKKERKVIPFWFKLSGIVAIFLIGLFLVDPTYNSMDKNKIVLENNLEKEVKKEINKKEINPLNKTKIVTIRNNNAIKNVNYEKSITLNDPSKSFNDEKKIQNNVAYPDSKNHRTLGKPKKEYDKKNPTNKSDIENKKSDLATNLEKEDRAITNVKEFSFEKLIDKNTIVNLKTEESIAVIKPNKLEEILKEQEERKTEPKTVRNNKWQITPNIASLYLNSSSSGSSIDKEFNENSKTYRNTMSFGIGINYNVTPKIAIRTGINKLLLAYNTNDIVYSTSLKNNSIESITYDNSKTDVEIKNRSTANLNGFEKEIQSTEKGALNQKMGYYEIPLELSYTIINKKFGITIIGGISTMVLNENKITVISSNATTNLGKANNLNQIHFSTNIGVGFKYQFLKSFQATFEPMFKHQINTYSTNDGNFKPYIIGLYTGISCSF